jgi:hypothetical protein
MMMSLNQPETQALGAIADGLAGADPRLASMLTIFSRLAAGEQMPARQTTRVRRGWPAVLRPRRARRYPRRGTAFPQPRRLYARLGRQQARLLVGAVISAALLTAALALTASGPKTCARPTGTACPRLPSRSMPTAGRVRVNSRDYRAAPAPMAGLGILLEAKAMHTGRPARNHRPRFGARPRQRARSLV